MRAGGGMSHTTSLNLYQSELVPEVNIILILKICNYTLIVIIMKIIRPSEPQLSDLAGQFSF